MTLSKILCFELFGDYAQFRKFFTNMSPLSFSIPPRTVLTGIIGAILGITKDENPESFNLQNSFIALRLMNPVKKTKIAHNYLKTNQSLKQVYNFSEHKPTNIEFLKNVRYRIYFACEDASVYAKLKSLMEGHQSIYSICLGISGCLANYEYIGEFLLTELPKNQKLLLNSVIPMSCVQDLILDTPLKLQKLVLPTTMKNNREVTKYEEVLIEMTGEPISLILNDASYMVEGLQDIIHAF